MHSHNIKMPIRIFLLIITTALAGACSTSPNSRYYTLQETGIDREALATSNLSVRVGPIYMPRYLKRPQMVTRGEENQMTLAEYDRWIEPLDQSFKRVLTIDISEELGSVWVHEFGAGNEPSELIDLQVIATVTRFDVDTKKLATLSMQWALSDPRFDKIYYATRSTLTQRAASDSYSDHAKVLSSLVAEMAKEIAVAIEQQSLNAEDTESTDTN